MRTVQEIFNVAMDSGSYTPRIGMDNALKTLRRENEITSWEFDEAYEAMMSMMEKLPSELLYRNLSNNEILLREEAEWVCYRIYKEWDKRYEILERIKS